MMMIGSVEVTLPTTLKEAPGPLRTSSRSNVVAAGFNDFADQLTAVTSSSDDVFERPSAEDACAGVLQTPHFPPSFLQCSQAEQFLQALQSEVPVHFAATDAFVAAVMTRDVS